MGTLVLAGGGRDCEVGRGGYCCCYRCRAGLSSAVSLLHFLSSISGIIFVASSLCSFWHCEMSSPGGESQEARWSRIGVD